MAVQVRRAGPGDDDALARLFSLYGEEFAYSLAGQDVAGEGLQARRSYAGGAVLVADDGGSVVGCVCLEPWGPGRCRMRRMVVDPAIRGQGVGRLLAESILAYARDLGYDEMCLDTTVPMQAATRLYKSLGFEEWEPDYVAQCRDTVYMRRPLVSDPP